MGGAATAALANIDVDPEERVDVLLRDLQAGADGLGEREAQRRLEQHGRNEITRERRDPWWRQLVRQAA